jgi:hypothetical protein
MPLIPKAYSDDYTQQESERRFGELFVGDPFVDGKQMSPAEARRRKEQAIIRLKTEDTKRKRSTIIAYVLIGLTLVAAFVFIVPRFIISKRERQDSQDALQASKTQAEIQQEITYQARSDAALERETAEAEAGDLA